MTYNPKRFLDRVAKVEEAYPDDSDFPSVLATSKYPPREIMNSLDRVKEFHEAFDCPVAPSPLIPDGPGTQVLLATAAKLHMLRNVLREYSKQDVRCLRLSLDIEEVGESATALAKRDLVGLLDAYGDKDYIDMGSVLTFGFELVFEEACRRIHESNMSKLGLDGKPVKDASGKVVKGPSYKPVVLDDLVDGTWLAANLDVGDFDIQASSSLDELLESPTFKPEELKEFQDRKFVRGIDRFASLGEDVLDEIRSGNPYVPSNAEEVANRVDEQLRKVDEKVKNQVDELMKAYTSDGLKEAGTEK